MNSKMLFLYNLLLRPVPSVIFSCIRVWFLRRCGAVIGKNCFIQENVRIKGVGNLIIGDNVMLRSGAFIDCGNLIKIGNDVEVNFGTILCANCDSRVIIGDYVHIAHNVSIKGSTHKISLVGKSVAGESVFKDIAIGEGSWLCAGCIILPGVTIGRRNVIAAGAVVLSDTKDDVLMAGVPAEEKKTYRNHGNA